MRILLFDKPLHQHAKKRPSAFPVAVALLSCLTLSACANGHPFAWLQGKHHTEAKHADAWSQDKQHVLSSIQTLQNGQQTAQNERNAIEDKQQSIEDDIANMRKRLETIEQQQTEQSAMLSAEHASIRQLQSSTVQLKSLVAKSKKSNRISKQKLVKKLDKIAKTIAEPVPATPVAPSGEKEKNSYTAAYLALKSGNYDEAALGFRNLLKAFPKGKYADQAWYWLGESYYVQHKSRQTIAAFEHVVKDYPKSTRHATAMLKLARAYKDAARPKNAKSMLKLLIQKHPDSGAAEQARQQLRATSKKNQ